MFCHNIPELLTMLPHTPFRSSYSDSRHILEEGEPQCTHVVLTFSYSRVKPFFIIFPGRLHTACFLCTDPSHVQARKRGAQRYVHGEDQMLLVRGCGRSGCRQARLEPHRQTTVVASLHALRTLCSRSAVLLFRTFSHIHTHSLLKLVQTGKTALPRKVK